MAKLRGKAKAAFLARMEKGRVQAEKRRRAIPKRKTVKNSRPKKKNPVRPLRKTIQKQIKAATKLFRRFSGMEPKYLDTHTINIPNVGMVIGKLDGVMYTTIRDGQVEEYLHEFTGRSRPLLCSSWDGKQLFIVGGSYNFTDEGIVDN